METSKLKISSIMILSIMISIVILAGLANGVISVPKGGSDVSVGNVDAGVQSDDDGDGYRTVTWIAFCSAGEISHSDIITLEANTTDSHMDPLSVDWESTQPVESVVLKSGKWDPGDIRIETFDVNGSTNGTVAIGAGIQRDPEVTSNSELCPGKSGVKFEWAAPNLFFYETESWPNDNGEDEALTAHSHSHHPNISIKGGNVPEEPVKPGSEIEITAVLQNSGAASGDVLLQLVIDGDIVAERTITVPANTEKSINFTHVLESGGSFHVRINDVGIGTIDVQKITATPTKMETETTQSEPNTQSAESQVDTPTETVIQPDEDPTMASLVYLLVIIMASIVGITIYRYW